jgi:hypothetical protein
MWNKMKLISMSNTEFWSGKMKGRDHLEDLGVDGKGKGKLGPVLN